MTTKKPVGVNVLNITFYKYDEDGNDILNKDGTTKEFELKPMRFKPLEYLCESLSIDNVEETKWPIEQQASSALKKTQLNNRIKKLSRKKKAASGLKKT